jgi:hypothetical protein
MTNLPEEIEQKTANPHIRSFEAKATTFDPFLDLRRMHDKFGFSQKPISKQQMKARLDFIQEELDEAYEALDDNHADDFVDANIDIIVVAIGNLDQANVNGWLAWDIVHGANMSKVIGTHSKRPEMKQDLVKPEGWVKPNHSNNVGSLVNIFLNDEDYNKANVMKNLRRRALQILDQAKGTMIKKAEDYNFPEGRVKSADYYPRGLDDFEHMLHVKYLRVMSIVDKMKAGVENNFETLTMTLEDLIVFSAMMAEFSEGRMDGQDPSKDLFGKEKK